MPRLRSLIGAAGLVGGLAVGAMPAMAQRIAPPPTRVESAATRPTPPAADAWIGEDKIQHFAASAAVTALAYGGARIALDDPDDARVAAIGAGAVAGLLKELHDVRRGTIFSVRDLVWDALGIAVGYLWIREIE